MRALPDLTRTSLPLCSTVATLPLTFETLMGPVTAIASPSMAPTVSPGEGLSGRAAAVNIPNSATLAAMKNSAMLRRVFWF
jgi:hypothetical protein